MDVVDGLIQDLRSSVFDVKDYDATGDGVTDDTAAITACLAAAEAAGGGVVHFPKGIYLTNGGHNLTRASIRGDGRHVSEIVNRGATYTFRLKNENSGEFLPSIEHVSIIGSTASLAAVNDAIGVQVSNGIGAFFNHVWVYGFTGTSAIGVQLLNVDGTTEFVENVTGLRLGVVNCTTGIQFATSAGSGTSFGYLNMYGLTLQVYASQTAIEIAGGMVYNGRIEGSLHYTGNDGIGIKVGASGSLSQGSKLDIRGEMLGAYTGCKRIENAGTIRTSGVFFIANGQPDDDYASALQHEFVEVDLTGLELPLTSLASGFVMTIPGGRNTWEVTGTDAIHVVASQSAWEGRTVTLMFASTASVIHNASFIVLAGGVDFSATTSDTLTLTHIGGVWYEVARSVN